MNKSLINITKSLSSKEDQGSPPITLEAILKKLYFYLSIDKILKSCESKSKKPFQ